MLRVYSRDKSRTLTEVFDFSAVHLIHDSPRFSKKISKLAAYSEKRLEMRVMLRDLISRLAGIYGFFLFNFDPLGQRFLQTLQREITKGLLFAA